MASAIATLLLGGALSGAGLVAAAAPASAVPITPVSLQARMVDHLGWDELTDVANPQAGDCARYGSAPTATTTGGIPNAGGTPGTPGAAYTDGTTGWVPSGSTVYSAHGNRGAGGCGRADLDLSNQSAVGFEPAALASIESGTIFNLGRMVHRNNPLSTLVNDWFRGWMQIDFFGAQLQYQWQLNETPNTTQPSSNPANDDVVDFLSTVDDTSFTGPDGNRYTLVVLGFTAPQPDSTCAPTLDVPGAAINRFETVEGTSTYGCLYAEVRQVRAVTVVKVADAAAMPDAGIPAFEFAATSSTGSPWGAGFTLTPTALGTPGQASVSHDWVVGEPLVITENPTSAPWSFQSLACVDSAGPLAVTSGTTITLDGDLSVTDPARADITCTYTNTAAAPPEPLGSLTITKTVTPRDGTPAAGYTGGDARIYPVQYACTVGGVEEAAGTAAVAVATPAVVTDLPAGAVCEITGETLTVAAGDFADATYAWDGFETSPATVTIVQDTTATLSIDNRFVRDTSTPTPTPTATPQPNGPTESPGPSDPGTPPSELPLTDGPGSLPLTGSGPVLPLIVVGAGLLLVGALTLGSVLRARRRE